MRLFRESIFIALSALRARKLRSALSILGIVVGILTVASLLSIALGVKKEITRSIEGLGSNLVIVLPGKVNDGGSPNFFAQLGASTLTEDDFHAIQGQAPEAQNLAMAMLLAGAVEADGAQLDSPVTLGSPVKLGSAFILAASPGFERMFRYEIDKGRLLSPQDEERRARVAVLGKTAASTLFEEENALRRTVKMRGESYEVVGVLAEIPSGFSLGGPDFNSIVLIPLQTGWEVTGTQQIFRIGMQAPDAEQTPVLREKVRQILLVQHGGEEDFSVFTQGDILGIVGTILNMLTAMLGAISAISLLVGGIGIMNIMLVSVSERTREIGIRKAVGATRFAILLQFLVESVMLTVFGGIIAVVIFGIGVWLAQSKSSLPISFDPFVLLLAVGFSAVVGILFGIVPAIRASRKHPVEALRYE